MERADGGSRASPRRAVVLLTALLGPALEMVVGPLALTGFQLGDGPSAWPVRAAGALLIAAGALVVIDSLVRFARDGRGTLSPAAPTRDLVVSGAYRYVRNPMYLATATVISGQALLLQQPVLLALAAVYLAVTSTISRVREQPLLERRFGASYGRYRAAVPGWLPRRRPWRG